MTRRWLPDPWSLLSIVLVLGGWQLVAWSYHTVLFPGPWETAIAVTENWSAIASEIGNTIRRAFTAFGISVLIMVPFGIACGRLRGGWLGFAIGIIKVSACDD